tara:strand:+ start:2027 stop:2254 length:228 start_codon:yes stop_codon:yes gene_type:complete
MKLLKPNKQEQTIIVVVICLYIGFALGAFSRSAEIKEKDEKIVELIDISDSLLNNFDFPNNTNHPNNFHKPTLNQ